MIVLYWNNVRNFFQISGVEIIILSLVTHIFQNKLLNYKTVIIWLTMGYYSFWLSIKTGIILLVYKQSGFSYSMLTLFHLTQYISFCQLSFKANIIWLLFFYQRCSFSNFLTDLSAIALYYGLCRDNFI